MKPRSREARNLRADLARVAVLDQAGTPLPIGEDERELEGKLRNRAAQRQVADEARQATGCHCQPGDAVAWARGIAEVVQVVYRLLTSLGVIAPTGVRRDS